MSKVSKKIILIICCLCIIVGGLVAVILLNKPKQEVPPANVVLNVISEKVNETSKKMATVASSIDNQYDTEEEKNISSQMNFGVKTLSDKKEFLFEKSSASEYLWLNNLSSRIIYAVGYLSKNATIENGYANGFEYNKVYMGPANIENYEGVVYIKTEIKNDGVWMYFDFVTEQDNVEIIYSITLFADYDFEKEDVNKIKMNYYLKPNVSELWSIEYDFLNNNFKGFQFFDYTFSHTIDEGNEIVSLFQSGKLDYTAITSYYWTHGLLVSGNITDDINKLSFNAYEYNSLNTENTIPQTTIKNFYNVLYTNLSDFKLRTTSIATNNAILVNYVGDCVSYGWNKAYFDYFKSSEGQTFYVFTFLEYEEILDYLTQLNASLQKDLEAPSFIKEIAKAALGYIESRGPTKYTGTLGTYNGIDLSIKHYFYYSTESQIATYYNIVSNQNYISFTTVNGEIADLSYFTN